MANTLQLLCRTFNISSDHNHLSANETGYFKAVRMSDANLQVGQVLTDGDIVKGITQEPRKKSEAVNVCIQGITKWRCGATVTRGRHLMSDATGRAVHFLGSGHACAQAHMSGATGDVIEVELKAIGFMATTEAL